jgi:hypothetical protein
VKKLAMDVVAPQSEYTWKFNVSSDSEESVTLRWDNTDMGDNGKELFLLDEHDQRLINMRSENSYTFKPTKNHPFRIYFGDRIEGQIKPTRIMAGDPYPNPSNGMAIIPFTLSDQSASYQVSIDIVDMLGRPVSQIYKGDLTPGFHTATWDASGDYTNGMYMFRVGIAFETTSEVHVKRIIITK